MSQSDSLDKLFPALLAAQAEFPSIPRDGYNPHFKSRFSSLKAVQNATRPVLAAHGLLLSQWPCSTADGKPALLTKLAHESGQWMEEVTPLLLTKSDPQAHGSAITYLRRYAWSSVLGLVTDEDDDDGNVATIAEPKASKATLDRIKDSAKEAGVTLQAVAAMANKKFGKAVPDLSPKQAETILDDLAAILAERQLGAVEVAK